MNEFERQLLDKLIDHLKLEEIEVDEIDAGVPLFEDGLELDSIDIIEIEVLLKQEYGIDILTSERTPEVFGTLGALAAFVADNRDRDA